MSAKQVDTTALRIRLHVSGGAFDIINPATGDGWLGLQFYLRDGATEYLPRGLTAAKKSGGKTTWRMEMAPGIHVHLEAGPSPAGGGVWIRPRLVNSSRKAFTFTGYGIALIGGAVGPRLSHHGLPVFAHSENLRYENLPYSHPSYPFIRPLPETGRWFGRQGLGPMPIMVLGKSTQDRWLLEGAATQDRATISWHLALPTAPERMLDYRLEYGWNGQAPDSVAAGENLALESTLYLLVNAPPDQFYKAYVAELAALHGRRFAGTTSRLAAEPVYCTWNYGIYTNITEAACVERIKLVRKLQGGGIFQLDHGYQPPHQQHLSWGYMDAYYPDTAATWDKTRFPGGPQRIVQECHKHGLTPAIWWTPRMDIGGPIARDHPDWIAINRQGQPLAHVGDLHPDYSVPAVRAFIERTIRTIIHDWGFQGIKLDFFSWAFDAPDLAYRHGGTSVQWRRWLLGLIRRELGPRGYFLYCVSCPLGNPFLALDGCDAFRAGTDIDRGSWASHVANCAWILASFPALGRETWFVDMDSFLGSPDYPAHERRFRCAMGYLTAGMMDFSGPVEKLDAQAQRDYRLLSRRCDQGGRVQVPDRTAFFGRPLPTTLLRRHAPNSTTRRKFGVAASLGLFNWDAQTQAVSVPLAALGLQRPPTKCTDFWTGRPVRAHAGLLTVELPPRHHALIDISV